jgi:UDP-N-acetyl-D-mannosaminuronate dehydrogenase
MYDPHLTQDDLSNDHISVKTNLTEALEGVDCAIVTTNQDQFGNLNAKRMRLMMRMPAAIVDLDFVFDPDKIEKEGFTYRGLGRGAA